MRSFFSFHLDAARAVPLREALTGATWSAALLRAGKSPGPCPSMTFRIRWQANIRRPIGIVSNGDSTVFGCLEALFDRHSPAAAGSGSIHVLEVGGVI